MRIKTTAQALEVLRKHDAAGLYESLEPWQRQELLCIIRRLCQELAPMVEQPQR